MLDRFADPVLVTLVSAAVLGVVGAFGQSARRLLRARRDRNALDHAAITRASGRTDHGGRAEIFVHVACGASRKLEPADRIDPSAATELIASVDADGVFAGPSYAQG